MRVNKAGHHHLGIWFWQCDGCIRAMTYAYPLLLESELLEEELDSELDDDLPELDDPDDAAISPDGTLPAHGVHGMRRRTKTWS